MILWARNHYILNPYFQISFRSQQETDAKLIIDKAIQQMYSYTVCICTTYLSWLLRRWSPTSLYSDEAGSSSWTSHRKALYLASALPRVDQLVASLTFTMSFTSYRQDHSNMEAGF